MALTKTPICNFGEKAKDFNLQSTENKKVSLKDISGKNDSKDRLGGTLGSILFTLMQGVQILRVHDVSEVNQGIKVFKELLKN